MIEEAKLKQIREWRETAPLEERNIAALEMIADQLAFIDGRLFQIQHNIRKK